MCYSKCVDYCITTQEYLLLETSWSSTNILSSSGAFFIFKVPIAEFSLRKRFNSSSKHYFVSFHILGVIDMFLTIFLILSEYKHTRLFQEEKFFLLMAILT